MAASLRLKLWELTRLNREGALPLPPRWPARLASLFWPLVLLLGVAVMTALGAKLLAHTPAAAPPPERSSSTTERLPPASATAAPVPAEKTEQEPPQEPAEKPAAERPMEPPQAPAVPAPAAAPEAADPLLRQLGREGEADPLLAGVEPVPAAGVLRLRLTAGFGRLSRQERQERAEQWRERAGRLGYERLELTDGRGRPLGRSALVGSGMILLDPDPST